VLLGVAANGDVYPCDSFFGIEEFKAGNIRENSILDIWRESPVIKSFHDISIEKIEGCRDCELKYICGGGCLQENYEAFGAINKVSPSCSFMREIFEEMLSDLAKEMWSEQQ
jgi:radical SAM protein with 4Fe4S-binding SPASM domain